MDEDYGTRVTMILERPNGLVSTHIASITNAERSVIEAMVMDWAGEEEDGGDRPAGNVGLAQYEQGDAR